MSRTISDDLHKLIHSLSPAEVRYFKVFSSRHLDEGTANYVRLFDEIKKQDAYDEAGIISKFKKEKFIRLFSITKARLYKSILRALDSYHASSSLDAELKRKLHFAEMLFNRSLYDQSAKMLASAKKVALKYERHSVLLDIYYWEKKLIEKDNYSGTDERGITHFLEEDKLIGDKIKTYNDYWNIKSRLFMILNKQGKARTANELQGFKKIIDRALPETIQTTLPASTEYLYNHIYSAYYFGVGDYGKCHHYLKKNLDLIEKSKHVFEEEPNIYFSVLTNLIYVSSRLHEFSFAFACLNKLREVPHTFDTRKSGDMEIKLFSSVFSIEITLYNTLGDFDKAIGLVPAIEDGLYKYSGKINKLREAYFNSSIAVAYFGAERFSQALRWNNKILNDSTLGEHQDIHCLSKIFDLIIHIELKNESLLPYSYRSTYRYLKQRERTYKFEKVILTFVERMIKEKNNKQLPVLYRNLFQELQTLESDPLEQPVFEFFDFVSWAQSKAENRYFRKIIEERVEIKLKFNK